MSWLPVAYTIPVAHRGYSTRAPENTLAAYREALDAGATHVECDVHLSGDGTPYVIHDASVERTTDGQGAVKTLSDEALDRLDAGAWKDSHYADERVPRLEALLTLLKGRSSLALEVKAPEMERAVVDALNSTGFPRSSLTLFAFDFDILVRSLSIDPTLHCTYLIDLDGLETRDPDTAWASAVQRSQDAGMSAVGPGDAGVSSSRVQLAQEAGLSVFVWTVDDARRMRELSGWGVDAIMSNDVPLALETLKGT